LYLHRQWKYPDPQEISQNQSTERLCKIKNKQKRNAASMAKKPANEAGAEMLLGDGDIIDFSSSPQLSRGCVKAEADISEEEHEKISCVEPIVSEGGTRSLEEPSKGMQYCRF
jgi:hypothetical protein